MLPVWKRMTPATTLPPFRWTIANPAGIGARVTVLVAVAVPELRTTRVIVVSWPGFSTGLDVVVWITSFGDFAAPGEIRGDRMAAPAVLCAPPVTDGVYVLAAV
jgi:hypothetical protein